MLKYLLPIAAVAAIAGASSAYAAASASGTFNVKVNITTACAVSATPVDFGPKSTILGTETANSTVSVICNPTTPYTLSFTAGAAALTTTGNLVNGANNIGANYSLGTALAASGTGAGSDTLVVSLNAAAFPVTGVYQATQTVYVNY